MKIKAGLQTEYQAYYNNNTEDDYSKGVVDYTERWADLMESSRLDQGLTIEACAADTSHAADTEGITGFMYGCAVAVLARFWEHGEELRRWHNLKTQIGTEGEEANATDGVLNPALLNIQTK